MEWVRGRVQEAIDKGQAPSQKGAAPVAATAPAQQPAAAQAPVPAPVAPAVPSVSAQPTLQDLVKDHSKVNWSYNQAEEQHAKYIKGEVKYADLFDRVKAWFSLKTPKSELKQDGDKHSILVNQQTSYKQADLGDFYVGAKIAGKWYYARKPNNDFLVELTKQEYDTLKVAKNRVGQVIFYKIEEKDGKSRVRIFASLNYEKAKPILSKKEKIPELPPRPTAKIPFQPEHVTELPKPSEVKPSTYKGKIPFAPEHLTVPDHLR